jgi:hypothetical protein
MPRLKPPPNQKEDPKTLEVELEPDGTVVLDENEENIQELATDTDEQKAAKRDAAREYRQKKKEDEEALAASNSDLKRQLDEMKAAVEESRKQTQAAQTRQAELDAKIREREQENHQYLSRAEEAEYQSVLTAMAAAEGEAESSNRDLEAALTDGDHKKAADAQRRIARAEAKLVQLEEGKDILERRKSQAAARAEEARKNPPAPQNLSVEQQIDAVNALLPSQKAWLKEHSDSWTDQRKNMRLQGAHVEAEDKGLQPGTKGYFEYLEERLGYKKPDPTNDDDDDDDGPDQNKRRQERRTLVSAPVSRDAKDNSGKSKTKITLSEKQLEAAQIAGVDPQTYARNLMKLNAMKEDGYYDN